MNVIFDIAIFFEGCSEAQIKNKTVKIISFTGHCDSPYFTGEVLPGGTDVQIIGKDGYGTVCAKYILKGTDNMHQPCSVYVENAGIINSKGEMSTMPQIITDSDSLEWLQREELFCIFENIENTFHVKICCK